MINESLSRCACAMRALRNFLGSEPHTPFNDAVLLTLAGLGRPPTSAFSLKGEPQA
ncbi:protein of unknown function [Methylocella tundrae]|uniref:Uncharacterized protein n=1 Tax=Methylocella tundrae TaxID=227605 RepID=A0A4U8YV91_METTU|nr:protein of unknown function [Methylocella tundrae]